MDTVFVKFLMILLTACVLVYQPLATQLKATITVCLPYDGNKLNVFHMQTAGD